MEEFIAADPITFDHNGVFAELQRLSLDWRLKDPFASLVSCCTRQSVGFLFFLLFRRGAVWEFSSSHFFIFTIGSSKLLPRNLCIMRKYSKKQASNDVLLFFPGLVHPRPDVCFRGVLRPLRGQGMLQAPQIPRGPARQVRFTGSIAGASVKTANIFCQVRQEHRDRPHPHPLLLRLLRGARARKQVIWHKNTVLL